MKQTGWFENYGKISELRGRLDRHLAGVTSACITSKLQGNDKQDCQRLHNLIASTDGQASPVLAEFIGTFALIFVGIGAIKTLDTISSLLPLLMVSRSPPLSRLPAYFRWQLNPAVTFGLVCGGHMTWSEAFRYWIAQLLAESRLLSSVSVYSARCRRY